ncbi:MAG: D-ribitol-5-phosphate cytidylyltransferase [Clostridiales bacterium]|nr:D-ribitol-5-phosphate cytidylyltransferase [Clostridiales bacterium]
MNYAAILAGGVGSRMVRADRPKQFLELNGTPIIIYTVRRLLEKRFFDKLYIAVHPEWMEHLTDLLDKYGIVDDYVVVIPGGKERLDTITNVINAIDSDHGIKDEDKIFIHDAVRPFVTDKIIRDSLDALDTCDAVVAADPAVDTMLWIEDGHKDVSKMPARKNLYHGQAPDSFKLKVLADSLFALTPEERKTITGTAQICLTKGIPINTVPGDRSNIKITTDVDMAIAKAILEYNVKLKSEGTPYEPTAEDDKIQNSLSGAVLTTVEFKRVMLNISGYISDDISGDIEQAQLILKSDKVTAAPHHIKVSVKHRTFDAAFHISDMVDRAPLPTGSYKLLLVVDGKEYPSYLDTRLRHANFEVVSLMNFSHLRETKKHGIERYEITRKVDKSTGMIGWNVVLETQRDTPTFKEQIIDFGGGLVSLGKAIKRVVKDAVIPMRENSLIRLFNRTSRKYMSTPHDKKTILFASDSRSELGGNEELIYNRMIERGMADDFNYVFNYSSSISHRRSIHAMRKFTRMLATCDILIIDDFLPFIYKFDFPPEVKVVQAWHACGAFKSLGFERIGKRGAPKIDTRVHKCYTDMPVTSMHSALHHAEGFALPESVFRPIGVPRTDLFFDEEYKKKVSEELYELYPMLKGRKVYLYAPTFRGRNALNATFPYNKVDFETWGKFLKKEGSILILKMHPFVEEPVPIPEEYADYMIDLSEYREVNNILFITDVLITDYSSVMYEFSLLRRPMYFFAFDLIPYIRSRDFYEDYESTVPGYICETFASLMRSLYEEPDYDLSIIDTFVKKNFTYTDGKATDRFIDEIILR